MRYFDGCITKAEVRSRYRNLAMKLHPDRNGSKNAFIEMSQEYEVAFEKAPVKVREQSDQHDGTKGIKLAGSAQMIFNGNTFVVQNVYGQWSSIDPGPLPAVSQIKKFLDENGFEYDMSRHVWKNEKLDLKITDEIIRDAETSTQSEQNLIMCVKRFIVYKLKIIDAIERRDAL